MVLLNNLPGVAQPAIQEGKYVGKLIKARLAGTQIEPFKYFDKGMMATIGHTHAVADAFGRRFTGLIAYLMWGFHPRPVSDRLGQPPWHHLHLGPRPLPVQEPASRIITYEVANSEVTEDRTASGRPAPILPRLGRAAEGSPTTPPSEVRPQSPGKGA